MKNHNNFLRIKRSLSRGRDTYGWNLVSIKDVKTGKFYRACGGGYDMLGAAMGEWLNDTYKEELKTIAHKAMATFSNKTGLIHRKDAFKGGHYDRDMVFYGTYAYFDDAGGLEKVVIDGACGQSEVIALAQEIGLTLTISGGEIIFISPYTTN